jgi:hypothetical protein
VSITHGVKPMSLRWFRSSDVGSPSGPEHSAVTWATTATARCEENYTLVAP